jgi:hypothetical protein
MSELERQAVCSEYPESKQPVVKEATRYSITSSALTSLLPIAAASGIVHANYDTPKISFYSPSGSLIQPEGSSSPSLTPVNTGSPTIVTSYYNSPNRLTINSRSGTACLPPPRPTLVPLTTPPMTTVPLPSNLRHHHNYQHPERSQISSYESLIDPTTPMTGCGGVIRTHSTYPRSRTLSSPYNQTHSSLQPRHHRSTHSLLHNIRSDMSFYKSRYIALATQSRTMCLEKKYPRTTLAKRQKGYNKETAYTHYTSTSHKLAQEPRARSILGPFAGYTMRICFCQPYDGAGKAARAHAPVAGRDFHAEDEGVARLVRQDKGVTCRSGAGRSAGGGGRRIKVSAERGSGQRNGVAIGSRLGRM